MRSSIRAGLMLGGALCAALPALADQAYYRPVATLALLQSYTASVAKTIAHASVVNVGNFDWADGSSCPGTANAFSMPNLVAPTSGSGCWVLQLPSVNAGPLGSIVNQTSFSSLSGYTANGTTPSVSAGALHFSGGSGTFTQTLDYNYYTQGTNLEIGLVETAPTANSSSIGVGPGLRSHGQFSQISAAGVVYLTSGGMFDGQVCIQDGVTLAACSGAGNVLVWSAGDDIQLVTTRAFNQITVCANNLTTHTGKVCETYTYKFNDGVTILLPNIAEPAIFSFGGSVAVKSFYVSSQDQKGLNTLAFGDSKFVGYNARNYASAAGNLIQVAIKSSIESGAGDTTADLILDLPNVINRHPQSVILEGYHNDCVHSVPTATIEANIQTIKATLNAAGIMVYMLQPIWENTGVPQTCQDTISAWLLANFASLSITSGNAASPQICQPFRGTVPFCLASDNIHLDPEGNAILANNILTFFSGVYTSANYESYNNFFSGTAASSGRLVSPTLFIPTICFGNPTCLSTGVAYSLNIGEYTVDNSVMHFTLRMTLSSKGSATGPALVAGLPVAEGTTLQEPCTVVTNGAFAATIAATLNCLVVGSGQTIKLSIPAANGGLTQLADTDFTNTSDFFGSGSYFVAQ